MMKLIQGNIIGLRAIAAHPGIFRYCEPKYDRSLKALWDENLVNWKDGYRYCLTERGRTVLNAGRRI